MKAITPVIALAMLMLIAVGMVGIAYIWFSGTMSAQTKKSFSIPPGGAYCSGGNVKVYILNQGDANLTANDILVADMDGTSVINNGLVAHWKFDEPSGITAADSSGNGNVGTLVNNPERTAGIAGAALKFDGTNYVIRNPFSGFPSTAITAVFWMKTTGAPTNPGTPLSYASTSSDNDFLVYNYPSFSIFQRGASTETGVSANDGQWHHIAVTWKSTGGETKMYKDGSPAFSGVLSDGLLITNSGSLILAQEQDSVGDALDPSQAFIGIMDEVRIYNRILFPPEIKFLYGIKPGDSGLAIDYPAAAGKHVVKIGTSSNVAETSVMCK